MIKQHEGSLTGLLLKVKKRATYVIDSHTQRTHGLHVSNIKESGPEHCEALSGKLNKEWLYSV